MGQCSGAEVRGICTEAGARPDYIFICVLFDTILRRYVRIAGTETACYAGRFRVRHRQGLSVDFCLLSLFPVMDNCSKFPCALHLRSLSLYYPFLYLSLVVLVFGWRFLISMLTSKSPCCVFVGAQEEPGGKHVGQQVVLIVFYRLAAILFLITLLEVVT